MVADLSGKRVVLTGGGGFLGSHILKELESCGASDVHVVRSRDYDLRQQEACQSVVRHADIVIHAAAHVGGIGYNQLHPGSLFYDNAIMGIQLMEAARNAGVGKFVALGTICAYPKFTRVPFLEDDLWSGYPEETNAPYGLAKKMMLVQAQAYRAEYGFNAIYLLPVNLYGPRDEFGERSHVIPALIRKIHEAKVEGASTIKVWGDGTPSREFLYAEDAAEGIVAATMRYEKPDPVNLGTGEEVTIRQLAELICELMEFKGQLIWELEKPNGQPRRCLSTERAAKEFGFKARTPLRVGLKRTIAWYDELQALR